MIGKTLRYSVVVSLSAILFGYDTAVIAGAIESINTTFTLSVSGTGWAIASALVGCTIGAAISGITSDAIGRKKTLILTGLCYLLSAVGSALAWSFTSFWLLRLLGGIGIGLSAIVSMYIGEIAPKEHRGKLASLYQLAITLGILIVYFVNFLIASNAEPEWMLKIGWRIMIGSEVIPALAYLLLIFTVPESPRWLLMWRSEEEAKKVFQNIVSEGEIDRAIASIRESIAEDKKHQISLKSPGILSLVFIAVSIGALQQAVGINVIIYYGTSFMSEIGIGGENGAFIQSVMIGVVNFLSTWIALLLIDRYGRKPLLTGGAIGVSVCILLVGFALMFRLEGPWLIAPILAYIVFFAIGLGPLPWVVLGEIAPSLVRAKVLSIGVLALWVGNIIVSQTFPMINKNSLNQEFFNGALPFFVYGFFAILFVFFAGKVLPETKGMSLEDLSRRFQSEQNG